MSNKQQETAKSFSLTSREYWNNTYNQYRSSTLPSVRTSRSHYETAHLFSKALKLAPGNRVLEMGCGGSLWLAYLAKVHGCLISGVDYSTVGVEKSKKILSNNNVHGEIHLADFLNEESMQNIGLFDVVYSRGVIEHFEDPESLINNFKRFLVPGGILITIVPNLTGIVGLVQKWGYPDVMSTHKLITKTDLENFNINNRLEIIETGTMNFLDVPSLNIQKIGRHQRHINRVFRILDIPTLLLYKSTNFRFNIVALSTSIYTISKKL